MDAYSPTDPLSPKPVVHKEGISTSTKVAIVLGILLIGVIAGSILINKTYYTFKTNQTNTTQLEYTAFNSGVMASVDRMMQSTDKCQIASVKYNNVSRDIVDVNCVRELLKQQNITLK